MGEKKPYEPTPGEIKRACEAIRATWSEQERAFRAGFMPRESGIGPESLAREGWTPPCYATRQLFGETVFIPVDGIPEGSGEGGEPEGDGE